MKKFLFILLIIIIGFAIYHYKFQSSGAVSVAKTAPLTTKRHSTLFNDKLDTVLNAYFTLKSYFVDADSIKAAAAAKNFMVLIDSLKLTELKKDTAGIFETATSQIVDIQSNVASLIKQTTLTEMRQDFRGVSESLYPLLKTIHYEGKTLYWQNCPMAFGDDKGANWVSKTTEVINPYLGKNHPEYKGTMLHCGMVKDTIKAK